MSQESGVHPAGSEGTAVRPEASERGRAADFLELTKPRITLLVVVTALVGFYMAAGASAAIITLVHALLGTALVAGGASAFNMYLERNLDALMGRTSSRPLPAGRLQSGEALLFAVFLSAAGMIYLYALVNSLTSLLAALTFISYLFLYTPLKTKTWLSTLIGAVPGALPVAMGWAAATGALAPGAWGLFAIVLFWQLPHFYAIGWIYREDYARAGFPLLPVIDMSGERTGRQALIYLGGLVAASALPALAGISGWLYLAGALVLDAYFFVAGVRFARERSRPAARRLFFASIVYLPLLLLLLVLDKSLA